MPRRWLAAVIAMLIAGPATAEVEVTIGYLRQIVKRPPVLSDLSPIPDDLGVRGAELAVSELTTTGQFLGHGYRLEQIDIAPGEDLVGAAREMLTRTTLVLVDAPAGDVLAVADLAEAQGALLFNVAAADVALRQQDCRANLLHTLPSYAMRADALMQYLTVRRWTDLALLAGPFDSDRAYADALRSAAVKFGLRLREDIAWEFDGNLGRTAQAEIPLLTQGLPDHDILLVADEIGDFGRYVLFNTWQPRPVGGSEGITSVAWAPVLENWGATQLQNRFVDLSSRAMLPQDYAAWAATRAIGEAVTRTDSGETETLRDYILSDTFVLDGFKGRPLSFRDWNGQLRQPMPVLSPRAMLAMAPFDAFLHRDNELDTLGMDRGETTCEAF